MKQEVSEVVKKFDHILKARRRRRALINIRREFEKAGYPLDQFGDSQLEAALTRWTDDIATVTLNANAIYRALRRLRGVPAGKKAELRPDELLQGR
jgi:hypothetical protein